MPPFPCDGAFAADDSDATGINTFVPHAGQMPRFPANSSLTWSLCPLGQVNRIPIACALPFGFHYRPRQEGNEQ